tara:strand:- start:139 stop:675 length:537 start_codon:yes stop_codon:yes gene_type:complete
MIKPTRILTNEHKNILKVITAVENECAALERGKSINKAFFEKVIDFIRNYADRLHHGKEEDILFKEFNKRAEAGATHCNPVQQMLHEHELGRGFVKGMEDGLNENNKAKLIKNANQYASLLIEHIYKEDEILYAMADEAIDAKTMDEIGEKFKRIDLERKKDIDKYLSMAGKLASEAG